MAKSGITRRIDELGRLVIPKEIRKNLKIRDNDEIEISIINDKIILSKYDILQKDNVIHQILLSIRKALGKNVLFTSRDKIIDYAVISKEKPDFDDLNDDVIRMIENRKEIVNNFKVFKVYGGNKENACIISPLIIRGDLYGSIILYYDEINNQDKSVMTFAKTFLENYLE